MIEQIELATDELSIDDGGIAFSILPATAGDWETVYVGDGLRAGAT